jgi:hypothetical protein
MATPADPHAYKATVMAVRNLFRRQAVTVEQAWTILLQREGGPEAIPDDARGPTRELLAEFGYVEHLVEPVGGGERGALWIRPDWLVETIEEVPLD